MANESQATVDARIAAAKSALQSKDYQKVNAALFPPVNRQAPVPMTGPELMSINDAKAAYLNQLSAAAAKGDASAKAALEMIQRQQNR